MILRGSSWNPNFTIQCILLQAIGSFTPLWRRTKRGSAWNLAMRKPHASRWRTPRQARKLRWHSHMKTSLSTRHRRETATKRNCGSPTQPYRVALQQHSCYRISHKMQCSTHRPQAPVLTNRKTYRILKRAPLGSKTPIPLSENGLWRTERSRPYPREPNHRTTPLKCKSKAKATFFTTTAMKRSISNGFILGKIVGNSIEKQKAKQARMIILVTYWWRKIIQLSSKKGFRSMT